MARIDVESCIAAGHKAVRHADPALFSGLLATRPPPHQEDAHVLPPRRLIICTDAKNEADDQFAIVHALLAGTLDVRGIVPSHFGRPGSMVASHEEVRLRDDE